MPPTEKTTESSASAATKLKRKPTKKAKGALLAALSQRQHEILGASILMLSLLLLIAIVAYSPDDDSVIENVSLFEFFSEVGKLATARLRNPLGFLGAKLSGFLVQSVLGYPTAILVLVSGYWGWTLFRQKGYEKASFATIYAVLFSILVASLFGLTHFSFSQVMSGTIGRFVAAFLTAAIGKFGAWAILLALLAATVVLFIDLDLQKTADRILYLFRNKATEAQVRFKEWYQARQMQRKAKQDAEQDEHDESEESKLAPPQNNKPETQKSRLKSETSIATEKHEPSLPKTEQSIVPPHEQVPTGVTSSSLVSENQAKADSAPSMKNQMSGKVTELPIATEKLTESHAECKQQAKEATHSIELQSKTSNMEQSDEHNPFSEIDLEKKLSEAEAQAFNTLAVRTTTNWAKAFAKESDSEIDDVLKEFLSKKSSIISTEREENKEPSEEKVMKNEQEPQITIIEPVKDATANLDDRTLEIKTKEKFTYQFPSVDLLIEPEPEQDTVSLEELEENKRRLLEKLRIYKIEITRIEATVGPRVTLFELELAPDVKVSRIVALQDDLAMAMAARGIRIIAPIPGKNAVGVEIPNAKSHIVRIKSLLNSEKFKRSKFKLPIAFGKTIANEIFIDDLAKMPHLLVAGATGSGKSVGINTILTSLLYFCSPEQVKFLLIDPKRVELFPYQRLKHHFLVKFQDLEEQIITDTSKAVYALKSVEKEMDNRYERLAKAGVRNLQAFNEKFPDDALPFIVVVIDELADMMITAGREVEEPIARLAQLARAVGIHLVVATQRPSVDVITGVIKANFPARIAYQVASKVDSRTILDTVGAEQLLGNGDMLYLPATQPKPIRLQNAFVSTEEVEAVTDFIYAQKGVDLSYPLPAPDMKSATKSANEFGDDEVEGSGERDKMFNEAARLVVRHQQGSVSLLQRRLKLGFGRAARIMDQLEEYGIVGPPDGSKPRQVLVQSEEELEMRLADLS
ncbi:MAG: DNA translocase FtsK 4TM domain-containing protein [Candidatus Thermochlorobacter sp.]